MTNLLKNLIIALVLIVLIFFGYRLFIVTNKDTKLIGDSVTAAAETQEFLVRLRQLRSIDVSGEIFSDPRFASLVDFRQELPDEPVGRINPFDLVR